VEDGFRRALHLSLGRALAGLGEEQLGALLQFR
jgi:hypothetical protein